MRINRSYNPISGLRSKEGRRILITNTETPFAFISYSHRDQSMVCSIVTALRSQGLRLWIDSNIEFGTTWDDDIANHILSANVVIAFVSKHYLNSDNCCDELNYAKDLGKQLLVIYMENVSLPSGMAMRMNRIQSIQHTHWSDPADLTDIILNCTLLKPCIQLDSGDPTATITMPLSTKQHVPHQYRKYVLLTGILGLITLIVIWAKDFNSHINPLSSSAIVTIDPFDSKIFDNRELNQLYVSYQGVYPTGFLTLVNNLPTSNDLSQVHYSLSNNKAAPGETIVVSASIENSNYALSRTELQYTVGTVPHFLTSPEEITQEQFQRIAQRIYNYCQSTNQDLNVYTEDTIVTAYNIKDTYFQISKYCDLFLRPDGTNHLFVFIDRSIDADVHGENPEMSQQHQSYNTLVAACHLSSLYIDDDGNLDFRSSDETYMEILGYYTSDDVLKKWTYTELEQTYLNDGYQKYELVIQP